MTFLLKSPASAGVGLAVPSGIRRTMMATRPLPLQGPSAGRSDAPSRLRRLACDEVERLSLVDAVEQRGPGSHRHRMDDQAKFVDQAGVEQAPDQPWSADG